MEVLPDRTAVRPALGYRFPLLASIIASAGAITPWMSYAVNQQNALLASGAAMALGIVCLGIALVFYAMNVRDQALLEAELAVTERDIERVTGQARAVLRDIDSGRYAPHPVE